MSHLITYQWGESGGVAVELDPVRETIEWVWIPTADEPGSVADITHDLEGSATWQQRCRWYRYLGAFADEPVHMPLDGDGFTLFREVYGHMAGQWIEEARAAQAGAA